MASPVSSVSVGTPYRDLPASMLFLGTGTEGYKSRGTSRASVKTVSEGASPVISSVRGTGLYAGEIHMGDSFEPSEQPLMSQLLSELDISAAKIEAMTGFAGGLNDGVWFVSGSRQGKQEELVLKLVKCQRIASNVPTEAENLEKVYQQHPTISSDETLAFPSKIFSCVAPDGKRKHDLIIMRRVPGERLAEVICRKYWAKQEAMLRQIFESLGQQLALFHSRYNKQHGDP
ncbi:unnamed protein product [Effrenium voratum]|nr:unnamed protein product [Effrenium voratum]